MTDTDRSDLLSEVLMAGRSSISKSPEGIRGAGSPFSLIRMVCR